MKDTLKDQANRAFRRYSPFIRDYIYRNGWSELRTVQILAADKIFYTESDLIVSAQTASGKTEAVFFPILSLMAEEGPDQFQVLYISPLKSLINDQFSRMEELLTESAMPVTRWHGDSPQSKKKKFLNHPQGLLQITPESLEAMLCRRAQDVPRIFANLKFVIIDEMHALLGSDRGNQILCLLQRIERLISYRPRRIALSATIGDPTSALRWLSGGDLSRVEWIHVPVEGFSWRLRLEHFFTDEAIGDGISPADELIYRATQREKCVIFSNSREETEGICAAMRDIAKKKSEPDRFYIHHGNLSAAIREDTEAALKNKNEAITAAATVTLELGVDIGSLKRVIHQGAPYSVSGFLQRLGRSGRRGEEPEMLMIFREEDALPNSPLYQEIPWDLLRGIAIVELYRRERWIEPAGAKPFPASLLFHQTLSVLAGKGSMPPSRLAAEVLSLSPFSSVSKEDYKTLLIHMLKNGMLEQTEEKELIVGTKAERILSQYKFFAVFKDSEDFTVRCESEEIGTIASTPPIGERFALAGRVWEVQEIDVSRRLIFVRGIEGKMKISWPGDSGEIHTRILEMMKEILSTDCEIPYLSPKAKKRLESARTLAKNAGMTRQSILRLQGSRYVLFPWLGTRAFQTLKRILTREIAPSLGISDVQSGGSYYITFVSERSGPEEILRAFVERNEDDTIRLSHLVGKAEYPVFDKYDAYLPQDLVQKAYAENRLNLPEARERISEFARELSAENPI